MALQNMEDKVKISVSTLAIAFIAIIVLSAGYILLSSGIVDTENAFGLRSNQGDSTQGTSEGVDSSQNGTRGSKTDNGSITELIAENLSIPWEVVFLPGNKILLTERPGSIKVVSEETVIEVSGVEHVGEGGLLGAALHPNFDDNNWIYLYYTTSADGRLQNKVVRYTLENNSLTEELTIIEGIAGASNHDGGRIAFGPDKNLYITTGDAGNPNSAQDTNSLNGKILRVTESGDIPEGNPFGNEVYSYGHRNPQGIAWDDNGNLWSTEHGPSGLQSGWDEINFIEPGKNYGWPLVTGDSDSGEYTNPVIHSGATDTWAPSGTAFYNDSIYFGGLRGESLYEYNIQQNRLYTHFKGTFGRIRAVVSGPDNFLYITTSNTDGRGSKTAGDDKLIRVDPALLER